MSIAERGGNFTGTGQVEHGLGGWPVWPAFTGFYWMLLPSSLGASLADICEAFALKVKAFIYLSDVAANFGHGIIAE